MEDADHFEPALKHFFEVPYTLNWKFEDNSEQLVKFLKLRRITKEGTKPFYFFILFKETDRIKDRVNLIISKHGM